MISTQSSLPICAINFVELFTSVIMMVAKRRSPVMEVVVVSSSGGMAGMGLWLVSGKVMGKGLLAGDETSKGSSERRIPQLPQN